MTTKTAQFTPGPWAADGAGILYAAPSEADEFEVIEINAPYNSQDRQLIAQVHAGFKCSQANATLIAAAPAMYEALREIVAAVGSGEVIDYSSAGDWYTDACAVLAQAEGR